MSALVVYSNRIYLGKISFQLQELFILHFSVCHEAGIWNFDTSVSTCIEVVLSAVELQNMKVRNLRYCILNSAQNIGLQNASWNSNKFTLCRGGVTEVQWLAVSGGKRVSPSFWSMTCYREWSLLRVTSQGAQSLLLDPGFTWPVTLVGLAKV